jgi:large subunit ribosomal protein L1
MAKDKTEKTDKKAKTSGKGERFADMSAEAVIIDEAKIAEDLAKEAQEEEKAAKAPRVKGKKYKEVKKLVDPAKSYPIKEAVELLKKVSYGKIKGTVEVHLNVVEKGLTGEAHLPYSTGKARKVVVFSDELAEQIKAGKIDFDVMVASPADMPKILPLAKALGPKGLMPNPKNGTLVPNPKEALDSFSANSLRFKTEKDFPIIHGVIGKIDQPDEELIGNFEALIKAVNPKYIKKVVLSSTMSPGIRVSL